jgi:RNA polymerase sigma factor (sigma-70 family)
VNSSVAKLVLVDDHGLVRAGIRTLLESTGVVDRVIECGDGIEAVRLVRQEQPQLVILDISLPGLNGLVACEQMRQQGYSGKLLMLSMHTAAEYVANALRAGADGYLLKDAAFAELNTAITELLAGRLYLSKALNQELIDRTLESDEAGEDSLALLTPRQRQILQLIAEGYPTREIAERLAVSVKTVESHRAQLMERLDIHNVPGLVRFAVRVGLVSPDS